MKIETLAEYYIEETDYATAMEYGWHRAKYQVELLTKNREYIVHFYNSVDFTDAFSVLKIAIICAYIKYGVVLRAKEHVRSKTKINDYASKRVVGKTKKWFMDLYKDCLIPDNSRGDEWESVMQCLRDVSISNWTPDDNEVKKILREVGYVS